MLDGKILAAVLATLAAFGVASGSQADADSPMKSFKIPSMGDLNPRTIGAFTGLIPEDKTTSEVSATLNYNQSDAQTVDISSKQLIVDNLTALETQSQVISSDESFVFEGFEGTVVSSEESQITGSSNSIVSSGVNMSGGYSFDTLQKTTGIKAVDVSDSDLDFEDVSGSVSSGSTSAELSDSTTDVRIRSFNGNLTFMPQSGEIVIDGEVSSLKAGDVSIG